MLCAVNYFRNKILYEFHISEIFFYASSQSIISFRQRITDVDIRRVGSTVVGRNYKTNAALTLRAYTRVCATRVAAIVCTSYYMLIIVIYSFDRNGGSQRRRRCRSSVSDFLPARRYASAVFATATCLSVCSPVCLSVCHTPVLCLAERKQDREMYTVW